jgi:putative Mg2+ transporter-C (MgtC) family protein
MDVVWQELSHEIPDAGQFVRVTIRLVGALLLASIVGWQRERTGHAAGLRTHLLVALGSALFTLVPLEAGASTGETTRIIQGIAAGIGFLGGGVILKDGGPVKIHGLTTAASIWLTAAIGMAAGLGRVGAAAGGVLLAWFVLAVLEPFEQRYRRHVQPPDEGAHVAD